MKTTLVALTASWLAFFALGTCSDDAGPALQDAGPDSCTDGAKWDAGPDSRHDAEPAYPDVHR